MADQSGNVNTEYKYDVFGQTQASGQASATGNPLQYTGRENDETGLYFYRNRYYSPNLRRFISRDPLRESAGENEYAYVSNSPTNFTDPLGLQQNGPVNALNEMGTGGSVVNILVDGDAVAEDAWIIGNECNPISERRWAAARMAGRILFAAFGGAVIGRFLGIGGRLLKAGGQALFKRIPCNSFLGGLLKKSCFVAGTLIHTKNGLVPIEEIKAGDEVLSYNEQTKQNEYKSVIETYIRQTETIVKLNVENEIKAIETTPEHPFFVKIHKARDSIGDDGEWRAAGELQIGDDVLTASGEWRRIVDYEQQSRGEQVYNFAVTDNHNYFVGQSQILVHNTYFGSGPAKGFLEVSSQMKSSMAVQNFAGKEAVDFVFDTASQRFVMGNNAFGHDGILRAARMYASDATTVGGRIFRENGKLFTNEWSGHYGQNWTPQIRGLFTEFMERNGVSITHIPW